MATKSVKKNKAAKGFNGLKAQVKNLHNGALNTSETLVEETLVTGEQWQKLFAKALKGGTKLFGQQQEMLFTGLEGIKDQYTTGSIRLRKLLTFKPLETKTREAASKIVKAGTEKVEAVAKKVVTETKKVKAVAKKATADSNKLTTAPSKKTTAETAPKAKPVTSVKKAIAKTTKINLTTIEGIGPKIAELLNKAGITTFEQLGAAKTADLKGILEAAGSRFRMHDPSTWAKQAKLAAAGKMGELKKWQDELKGGKKVKKS